jgi:hypothetical protein
MILLEEKVVKEDVEERILEAGRHNQDEIYDLHCVCYGNMGHMKQRHAYSHGGR